MPRGADHLDSSYYSSPPAFLLGHPKFIQRRYALIKESIAPSSTAWLGPTSSIFDFTTYIFMYFVFCPFFISGGVLFSDLSNYFTGAELAAKEAAYIGLFQAGWFVESMWSQTLVIHMIRTPKIPFIESRASFPVTFLTMTGIAVLTVIPFTAFGETLGFVELPAAYFEYLIPCILLYMALATSIKKAYVRYAGELL